MAQPKTPLFSLKAHGSIADTLTYQKRGSSTIARKKPIPTDPKSLAQIYQRWDYQDYATSWHYLTAVAKQLYETNARPLHMTGFALYMRTMLSTLPDIAGRWRLDERTGAVARDTSKNENPGTIYGATHVAGHIDYALKFDGIDDGVRLPTDETLEITNTITLEAFFKTLDPTQDNQQIINKYWGQQRLAIHDPSAGKLRLQTYFVTTGGTLDLSSDRIINPATYYHAALTYDNAVLRLFLNGDEVNSDNLTGDLTYHGRNWRSGSDPDAGLWFDGLIDNVIFYTRALRQSELKRHSERRYPL